jgi:hypothetical protein
VPAEPDSVESGSLVQLLATEMGNFMFVGTGRDKSTNRVGRRNTENREEVVFLGENIGGLRKFICGLSCWLHMLPSREALHPSWGPTAAALKDDDDGRFARS